MCVALVAASKGAPNRVALSIQVNQDRQKDFLLLKI